MPFYACTMQRRSDGPVHRKYLISQPIPTVAHHTVPTMPEHGHAPITYPHSHSNAPNAAAGSTYAYAVYDSPPRPPRPPACSRARRASGPAYGRWRRGRARLRRRCGGALGCFAVVADSRCDCGVGWCARGRCGRLWGGRSGGLKRAAIMSVEAWEREAWRGTEGKGGGEMGGEYLATLHILPGPAARSRCLRGGSAGLRA